MLCNIRNPVKLARVVMDSTRHILLAGSGAEELARSHAVQMEQPDYFHTQVQL